MLRRGIVLEDGGDSLIREPLSYFKAYDNARQCALSIFLADNERIGAACRYVISVIFPEIL